MAKTKADKAKKHFIFTAEVLITADSEADARIDLIGLMDEHDIEWDVEEESELERAD